MNEFGEKQCNYIQNYILDNLDKKTESDIPYYDYRIPIGVNYIYVKIRLDSVIIRTRFIHLTSYDMDFYWTLKYSKSTKLWDKVKSFIKKILNIQQGRDDTRTSKKL